MSSMSGVPTMPATGGAYNACHWRCLQCLPLEVPTMPATGGAYNACHWRCLQCLPLEVPTMPATGGAYNACHWRCLQCLPLEVPTMPATGGAYINGGTKHGRFIPFVLARQQDKLLFLNSSCEIRRYAIRHWPRSLQLQAGQCVQGSVCRAVCAGQCV